MTRFLLLLPLLACVLCQDVGLGPAQCPIFRFTSNVVSDANGGWSVTFNPQTSKTLDFVIVHYRSNPNGDWINQRMTSISNSEWIWPLDIDLFTGDTLQYWFTYCAERVDCDSPQFTFTVPTPQPILPPPVLPPATIEAPYTATVMAQQAPYSAPAAVQSPPVSLAPAYVTNNGGGRYGGGKGRGGGQGGRGGGGGRGYGHGGGYGDEAVASVPYTVGPATVYQSAPVAYPEDTYASSYGSVAGPTSTSAYGGGSMSFEGGYGGQQPITSAYGQQQAITDTYGGQQAIQSGYGGQQAITDTYGGQQAIQSGYGGQQAITDSAAFNGGATIIPSAAFADGGGHGGRRGARGGGGGRYGGDSYPVIGAQPVFGASVYGGGGYGGQQAPQGGGQY